MSDIEIDVSGFARSDHASYRALLCPCGQRFTYGKYNAPNPPLEGWISYHRPHLRAAPTEPAPAVAPAFRKGQRVRILSEPCGVENGVRHTGQIGQVVNVSPTMESYSVAGVADGWLWSFLPGQLAAIDSSTPAATTFTEALATRDAIRDGIARVADSRQRERMTGDLARAIFAEEHEAEAERFAEVTRTKQAFGVVLIQAGTRDGSPDVETERVLGIMRTKTKVADWERCEAQAKRLVGRMGGT